MRASQALAFVGIGEEDGADFRPRPFQDFKPFLACLGERTPVLSVAREVFAGDMEPGRIFLDLLDDEPCHVEHSGVDVRARAPVGSSRRLDASAVPRAKGRAAERLVRRRA